MSEQTTRCGAGLSSGWLLVNYKNMNLHKSKKSGCREIATRPNYYTLRSQTDWASFSLSTFV